MAAYGYIVYLIRAATPFRPKALQRLSSLGDADDDLLQIVRASFDSLGPGYQREAKTAEGYRVRVAEVRGRTLDIRINKGPEGSTGETWHLDDATSVETTERQAQLSALRALLVVPEDSYYGLLFVERIGVRHLKQVLADTIIRVAAQVTSVVMRVESFAETSDWERELDPQQTMRVSRFMKATDSGDDASTPDDTMVKIITEGGRLRASSDYIKELVLGRLRRRERRLDVQTQAAELERRRKAGPSAFTVQDEEELQRLTDEIAAMDAPRHVDDALASVLADLAPVDTGDLEHERFDVVMGTDRPERTFVVEKDSIPQFVYELGARLTDGGLRNTWLDHAETILGNRGVSLPRGWKS